MKYFDKDGSEWSIEKGDWIGSFDKDEKHKKRLKIIFSIPLLLILVFSLILLS